LSLREAPLLHIICRSYGGENKKGRPDYYSKHLALSSLVRAFRALKSSHAELIFLNDGPIPPDRLRLMEQSGEVLARSNLGLRGSMRSALALPVERKWHRDDIVWLAEDDYLYLPEAFAGLMSAVESFPDAAYFGLYAQIGSRQPNPDAPGEERVPKAWKDSDQVLVENHPWRRALSTTSTFGARVNALVQDQRMMRMVMLSGGAWDHTTCLIYQGYRPYPLSSLLSPFRDVRSVQDLVRTIGAAVARGSLNCYPTLRALGGVSKRQLIAPDPALITHLETAYLACGTDWTIFAKDMQSWVDESSIA
jgi:hypothetical protein